MEQTPLPTGYPLHRHDVQRIVQTVARRIVRLCHLARPAQREPTRFPRRRGPPAPRHHPAFLRIVAVLTDYAGYAPGSLGLFAQAWKE